MILLFSSCGCNNDLPVLVKTVVWLMCQETATTQVCSITPSSWKFRYFQSKLFHPLSRLFSSRVSVGGVAPWASDKGGTEARPGDTSPCWRPATRSPCCSRWPSPSRTSTGSTCCLLHSAPASSSHSPSGQMTRRTLGVWHMINLDNLRLDIQYIYF